MIRDSKNKTYKAKQTKTQGLLVTSWSCFPPYLLPRPLPPPLPQTVIPYWNCDAICQIRLGKYRPFPSPSRILCFLAKIDPFPKNYISFNEIDRPTIIDIASFSKIIIILSCKTQSLKNLNTSFIISLNTIQNTSVCKRALDLFNLPQS